MDSHEVTKGDNSMVNARLHCTFGEENTQM